MEEIHETILFSPKDLSFIFNTDSREYNIISIGIKEFSFDNYIFNILENFLIDIKDKDGRILHTIKLEPGHYEYMNVVDMVNTLFKKEQLKEMFLLFNPVTSKYKFTNNHQNKFIHFNKVAQDYFNLPNTIIKPKSEVESLDVLDNLKTRTINIGCRNIVNGIRIIKNNQVDDRDGTKIIHTHIINSSYGRQEIYVNQNKIQFFDFCIRNANQIEMDLTDENGVKVNIRNIIIKLLIKCQKR